MIQHDILSENSDTHWHHFDSKNKILLDLGCGLHEQSLRNNPNQTSPFYLGEKGANRVIAIDMLQSDIDFFKNIELPNEKYTFICNKINSAQDIISLINEYKITAIKCDIEGYETNFYPLTKENMQNILELGIEYHSYEILENIIGKINEWGFTIKAKGRFAFVDCPQMGVLFCSKNKL